MGSIRSWFLRLGRWGAPVFSPRPFPRAWWVALAVLLLNDHWLKGAGLLPGWLTGKLSDFAGMIVAPVLLSRVLRTRTTIHRAACFVAVLAAFASIKLSPWAADRLVHALSLVGIHWRIWSDPTDLLALAVLPFAWAMASPRQSQTASLFRPPSLALHRLGVVLGAVACLATSEEFEEIETAVYLLNLTHKSADVRIFRLKEPPDCSVVAADPRSSLTADLFAFENCKSAKPFVVVPLDSDWIERDTSDKITKQASDAGSWRVCDAVVVRVAGSPDTVVFWNQISKVRLGTSGEQQGAESDPHAVWLQTFGNNHVLGAGSQLQSWPVNWTLPPANGECRDAP